MQEGNVFSRVCLSVCPWERVSMYKALPPDMLKLVHLGPQCTGPHPHKTCSKFFTMDLVLSARWTIAIKLKCLLVLHNSYLDYTEACLKDNNHLQAMVKITLYFFCSVFVKPCKVCLLTNWGSCLNCRY